MYPHFDFVFGILCSVLLIEFGTSDDFLQSGAISAVAEETSGSRIVRQSKFKREPIEPPPPPSSTDGNAKSTLQKKPEGRSLLALGGLILGGIGASLALHKATTGSFVSSVDDDEIVFRLFTKKGKDTIMKEDSKGPDSVDSWINDQDVIIIVHGWLEDGTGSAHSAQKIKTAYMDEGRPENIIIVDWGKHSANLIYSSASRNVQTVGNTLAQFINNLIEKKFVKDLNNIHIIGFSLGGHIAGVAGHKVQKKHEGQKIGWITGLDPNWENFEDDVDNERRLTADDAQFVDVIHCNMGKQPGKFGTTLVIGTADFFPNGGEKQPECEVAGIEPLGCSTKKCFEFYSNSIKGKKFKGCKCDSFKELEDGKCEECETLMGEKVPKTAAGKYYLHTKQG